jgi:hypothetical protein
MEREIENAMSHRAICCFLTFFVTAVSAKAQETRSFPEAECSYTLPGNDWEWLDPKLVQLPGGKTIAFARNKKGLAFTLRYDPLKANEKPKSNSYESFEFGLLSSGRIQKQSSKHLSFKGIASYQIDAKTPEGQGTSIRILYANDRFYHLSVVCAFGPLGPDEETEAVFQGFNFTGEARPMLPTNEDSAFQRGQAFGRAVFILMVAGVVGLVSVAAVVLIVFLIRKNKRKETSLGR